MTARVEIRGVSHRFGRFAALTDINLAIEAGRFTVLLGPSGCGKTTLLSILGGFLHPSEGRVLIGEQDVTDLAPAARATTTMFQDYALFPHMSLGANVAFGLRMRGWPRAQRESRARELLALVSLEGAFAKRPHELSGGQRQRVALARALAVEPDVLLLDEPLGALDLKLRRQMQDELKTIQKRVGTTFVHVTHDQEEAMAIADEIVVMNQGRIEDIGAPQRVYLRPGSLFAAGFMGEANLIPGRIAAAAAGTITLSTAFGSLALPTSTLGALAPTEGRKIKLCIRPEHLKPNRDNSELIGLGPARVVDDAFFGTHYRCHLTSEAQPEAPFVAYLPQTASLTVGDTVALCFDPAAAVILADTDK